MNADDMPGLRSAVLVFSQSVAALIEMEGMKALNAERDRRGHTPGYNEAAFAALIDRYSLGWNAVVTTLNGGV